MGNTYIYGKNDKPVSEIEGGSGADTITVTAKSNYFIQGGDGGDKITVTGGSGHYIYGDHYRNYDKGNDQIILTNVSNSRISGGDGKDTITINSGNNNEIYGGWGDDTFNIKGGSGNYISNGSGNFTANISGGSGTLTGYSDGNSKVYVDWAKPTAIGKFIINDDAKTDTLYFKNTTKAAFSKDNFSKDGYRLTIDFDKSINGVGEVVIDNWSDNSSYCAFKGTIYFVDKNNKLTGESLTYNEIKSFLS